MPTSQKQRQHSSVCWQKPAQCCTLIGEVGKHLPAACPPNHPPPPPVHWKTDSRLGSPTTLSAHLPRAQEISVEQPCSGFLVSRKDSEGGCASLMTLLGIPDFHLDTVKDSVTFFSSPACLWHSGPQGVPFPSSWRRQQSHLIRCGLSWAEDKIALSGAVVFAQGPRAPILKSDWADCPASHHAHLELSVYLCVHHLPL